MADDDHVDGPAVSGSDDDNNSAEASETPEVAAPTRSAPLRSAPLRRRNRRTSSDEAVEKEPEAESGTETDAAAEPAAVDLGKSDSDEAQPDPSEVERTLTYRERRKQRGAAPTRNGVRYSGRDRQGTMWWVLGAVAVVLTVALVAASIALGVGLNRAEHRDDLRAEYSSFARQMIVDLTTLNPKNVDTAMTTLQTKTSGKALQQMQDSMKQAIGLVREQNLDTRSTIISDAVTVANPDDGTVILVSGWEMKSPDPKQETVVQTFRWRLQLTRINGDLKLTNFEWVT